MSETYIVSRKNTGRPRPQGLLFADAQGSVYNEYFVPDGTEFTNFIVLTDDNRENIDMSIERIEQRKRMINGRMRSYHIADKRKLSVQWQMIPSRAFAVDGTDGFSGELWDATGIDTADRFTTDGGAGGVEMLKWYNENQGSFWVFLAYDKHTSLNSTLNVAEDEDFDPLAHLGKYNERIEMYFSEFSYDVVKRGPLFDFWNVNLSLEEA